MRIIDKIEVIYKQEEINYSNNSQDLKLALSTLGYQNSEIDKVIKLLSNEIDSLELDELIKKSLQLLTE